MSREDQYAVSVVIDARNLGIFDKMGGGEVDSDDSKYRPGGMGAEISLGGTVSVGNLNISRMYDLERDHPLAPWLLSRAGKGQCRIIKQPLDTDGNAFGAPTVYTGRLKQVSLPDVDSESSDAGMLGLEVSSASTVS
jgi:hypothetical protein